MDEATLGMYASRVWGGTKWCYPNLERLLKEKATLETQLAAANEAVRVLGAKIRADAAFGCDIPSRTDEERRDIRNWHWKATDDVLKNPLARASVEKAGKTNE